jgi:hypothetical protein
VGEQRHRSGRAGGERNVPPVPQVFLDEHHIKEIEKKERKKKKKENGRC